MQRQPQQPENGVIDPVGVDLHGGNLPDPEHPRRGPGRMLTIVARLRQIEVQLAQGKSLALA
jgi:hypothetical protein